MTIPVIISLNFSTGISMFSIATSVKEVAIYNYQLEQTRITATEKAEMEGAMSYWEDCSSN
eukprot:52773-Karenia_brevis.AAC.1